jgi:anthranilate phosphoribosyltransferase
MDISGGGGGKIGTFNVSTAAAIVIAAGGVYVAKQAAPAVTGFTGSRDILEELGVDIPLTGGDPHRVEKCLEQVGIAAYYYTAFSPERFENFLRWRATIKRIGLSYLTPWHIVSFVYSLVDMKNRVYGLFTDKYLRTIAELFKKFGYKRVLAVHGINGLDEISNVGPTKICELKDGDIDEYIVTPEELGVKRARPEDIQATSREGNIIDFLRVIYGKDKGPKRDIVALNAGAGFYVAGNVKTLKEGTQLAISLLDEGDAALQLERFVAFFGNQNKLEAWKKHAGV